jgi:predicted secreted protein
MVYIDATNPVAGERTSTVSLKQNLLDANSKSNPSWDEFVTARRGGTIAFSGIEDTGDTGMGEIYTHFFAGTETTAEVKTFNSTKQYSGGFFISDFSQDSAHDGLVGFSCTLTANGAILYEGA